jgi:hypothetical protein
MFWELFDFPWTGYTLGLFHCGPKQKASRGFFILLLLLAVGRHNSRIIGGVQGHNPFWDFWVGGPSYFQVVAFSLPSSHLINQLYFCTFILEFCYN